MRDRGLPSYSLPEWVLPQQKPIAYMPWVISSSPCIKFTIDGTYVLFGDARMLFNGKGQLCKMLQRYKTIKRLAAKQSTATYGITIRYKDTNAHTSMTYTYNVKHDLHVHHIHLQHIGFNLYKSKQQSRIYKQTDRLFI